MARSKRRDRWIRIAALGTGLALACFWGIGFFIGTLRPPLTLNLVSTETSTDGVHSMATLRLSNRSSRTWTYAEGSDPFDLWRLEVKVDGAWKRGYFGGHAGSSWSTQAEIRPSESQMLTLVLPADGAERRVGAFLRTKGLRPDSRLILNLRQWYCRVFHRELVRPGEFCSWSTESISNRALLDRGLLATNGLLKVPFDSNRWKSAKATEKIAMARDLDETGLLIGKHRSEVHEMLGDHDSTGGPESGYWFLGFEKRDRLGFPESRLLNVVTDSESRVRQVRVAISFDLFIPRKARQAAEPKQ